KYLKDKSTETLLDNNHKVINYIIVSLAELTTLISK
ncbi:alpha-E domain-containing protein, partial [Francisella tularensis subsp. holarctica]|nr:alpha-E domain-containing protein [Francisella tularensis subsp. holarctica]